MICYYLDYKTSNINERDLAQKGLEYKKNNLISSNEGVSLITCHRIEYYLDTDNKYSHDLFKDFKIESNIDLIKERLLKICIGLESKIIGEKAIQEQVIDSIKKYSGNLSVLEYKDVLDKAKKIREKFDFSAPNHGQLIVEHLVANKTKTLVIVGAGFLTRSIIETIGYSLKYKNIIVVTRNIKKAEKHILNIVGGQNVKITTIKSFNEECINEPFDIIIATDNIDKNYSDNILYLCSKESCVTICDLSSVPISGADCLSKEYFNLYSQNMNNIIEKQNQMMRDKITSINTVIKN
ncbi:MAG: hypothetical protein KBC33_03405 [Candidatus Pacebacteria bacterium]|nr:hypothetical protein [Candidatus Paceibacterota bacterium]